MATEPDHVLVSILAVPEATRLVRVITRAQLRRWGRAHIRDDALLVASELTTNAITASPEDEIRYLLIRQEVDVLMAVWDAGGGVPTSVPPPRLTLETLDLSPEHFDDNGGWGLPIVAVLAADNGHVEDPGGGKWVWARLKC